MAPKTRTNTSFWKDVRGYLESIKDGRKSKKTPPIAVRCICKVNELSIQGLPPANSDELRDCKPASVTICGHMACRECLDDWYVTCIKETVMGEPSKVTCPLCRHHMHFAGEQCRHPILYSPIRPAGTDTPLPSGEEDLRYLKAIPPILPEEGGEQLDLCWGCHQLSVHTRLKALEMQRDRDIRWLSATLEPHRLEAKSSSSSGCQWLGCDLDGMAREEGLMVLAQMHEVLYKYHTESNSVLKELTERENHPGYGRYERWEPKPEED